MDRRLSHDPSTFLAFAGSADRRLFHTVYTGRISSWWGAPGGLGGTPPPLLVSGDKPCF